MSSNIEINAVQLEKLTKLVSDNPKIFSSNDLTKLNRCISYMTFILKEIYDFVNAKHEEIPIQTIRFLKKEISSIESALTKF